MFDRIMENTRPLWMLVSALFPIFLFGTLIRAWLHMRKARRLPEPRFGRTVPAREIRSEDWVPAP